MSSILIKPKSIPAGQSMKIKSKSDFFNKSKTVFMLSLVTLYLCLFLEIGSKAKFLHLLSRINACSNRHSPSNTSIAVYTTRFSNPSNKSKFLKPISASTRATEYPRRAMDMPRFAELVVFPTPPFPEVTTTVLVSPVVFRLEDDSPSASALVVTFLVGVVVRLFKKTDEDENDRPLFFLLDEEEEEEDKTYDETRCCCAIIFLNVFVSTRDRFREKGRVCVYCGV